MAVDNLQNRLTPAGRSVEHSSKICDWPFADELEDACRKSMLDSEFLSTMQHWRALSPAG